MKHSTIKDLFYEKVGTVNSIKTNKACLKLSSKLVALEELIIAKSNQDVIDLLNKYFKLQAQIESEMTDYYYVEGFKIGARVALECAGNLRPLRFGRGDNACDLGEQIFKKDK